MLRVGIIKNMGGIVKPGYRTKYKKEYNSWNHIFTRLSMNDNITIDNDFLDFEKFVEWYNKNKYSVDNELVHMYTLDGNYNKESIVFIPKKLLNCIQNHKIPVKGYYSFFKGTYTTKIYDCLNGNVKAYRGNKEKCIDLYTYYKIKNSNILLEYYKEKIPMDTYLKVKKIINSDDYVIIKDKIS